MKCPPTRRRPCSACLRRTTTDPALSSSLQNCQKPPNGLPLFLRSLHNQRNSPSPLIFCLFLSHPNRSSPLIIQPSHHRNLTASTVLAKFRPTKTQLSLSSPIKLQLKEPHEPLVNG
ncbi:hypothetical protein HAX54_035068 [Datura stramonium]|uniref:Uncharacterized protein n=1 Tax=Datura stramonium TaxID=4076 RepID=A0ABS8VFY3_DATST|nr:hypothetical protein [Datura stramonium]